MPAPGSLTGDSLANFKVFFPELERTVSSIVWSEGKPELNRFTTEEQAPLRNPSPKPHWQDSVQAVIDRYVGACPETFVYEGKTYTPKTFAESLGLDLDDYVSLTSYTHRSSRALLLGRSLQLPYPKEHPDFHRGDGCYRDSFRPSCQSGFRQRQSSFHPSFFYPGLAGFQRYLQ